MRIINPWTCFPQEKFILLSSYCPVSFIVGQNPTSAGRSEARTKTPMYELETLKTEELLEGKSINLNNLNQTISKLKVIKISF